MDGNLDGVQDEARRPIYLPSADSMGKIANVIEDVCRREVDSMQAKQQLSRTEAAVLSSLLEEFQRSILSTIEKNTEVTPEPEEPQDERSLRETLAALKQEAEERLARLKVMRETVPKEATEKYKQVLQAQRPPTVPPSGSTLPGGGIEVSDAADGAAERNQEVEFEKLGERLESTAAGLSEERHALEDLLQKVKQTENVVRQKSFKESVVAASTTTSSAEGQVAASGKPMRDRVSASCRHEPY